MESDLRDLQTAAVLVAGIEPPLSSVLPNTDYFEVVSRHAGARYAIWVTTPVQYEQEGERRYPAIYLPDGNITAPLTAAISQALRNDPINPIKPFVQICIGYIGEEFERSLAVRARDLLPPAEALPEGLEEGIMEATVKTGFLDQAGAELYLHNLRNPAGDKFLRFLTEELHPLIADRYRVCVNLAGLFGYSYGGLFAAYVALTRSPLFQWMGAGSPGILPQRSSIFEMYRAEVTAGADHGGRMLHVTVNQSELTMPSIYQSLVGPGTVEFITLAGQQPLRGLSFSSELIPNESHATGIWAAYASFLRRCFAEGNSK